MVKELRVDDPNEGVVGWDEATQYYYELAVEGIPLPDKLADILKTRFSFHGDPDPRSLKAAKEWDAYMVWYGGKEALSEDPRSPRERLTAYYAGANA